MKLELNIQKDFNIQLQPDKINIEVIGSPFQKDNVLHTQIYYEVMADGVTITKGNYELPAAYIASVFENNQTEIQAKLSEIVWSGILTGFSPVLL